MAEILKDQKENARKITVEDRAAELNDKTNIDFEGFVDGVAFEGGKGENYDLVLGSNTFIPGFEDQIVGKKIGEEFDVNVTFPEEYQAADLAGKPAVFKCKLNSITAEELPELDDEFAAEVSSFETFAEYKEDKKNTLQVKKDKEAEAEKQEKVVAKVAENATVEIPEPMIVFQQDRMLDEFGQRLMYQGLQLEQYFSLIKTTKEEFKEQIKPDAIARIKSSLVLEAVAAKENLTVSDEEVDEEIQKMADAYQMKADEIKDMMGEKEMDNIRKDLAARAALKFLADNCKEV